MGTPAGSRIDDGFSTLVTFPENPTISLWIKTVKPPGFSGGGGIPTNTMHSVRFRTKAPKSLLEITDGELQAAYDPAVIVQIFAMAQVLQLIVILFADGSTQSFWGWLDEFEPDEVTEGEQPTAAVKFICSGENASGVETAPAYGSAPP